MACLTAFAVLGGVGVARATSPDGAAAYVPVNPCRLLDTRPGSDSVGVRSTPLGPDEAVTLNGRGSNGNCAGPAALPDGATGLQLNVTAVNASQATYLTLHPTGAPRPKASHLNPAPNAPAAPNAVTVKLDDAGRFDVYNRFGTVDVIIDVVGLYTDHHHDDRYYTRAEVDTRTAPEPWSIEVSMGELVIRSNTDAVLWNRFLSGTALTRYDYSVQLPTSYVAGRDVLVETMYDVLPPAVQACGVHLEVVAASRFRGGEAEANVATAFVDLVGTGANPVRATLTVPPGSGRVATTVTYRLSGSALAPGDWIRVQAGRVGTDVADTCATIAMVGLTLTEA